jgi:precorrin-2 methylase
MRTSSSSPRVMRDTTGIGADVRDREAFAGVSSLFAVSSRRRRPVQRLDRACALQTVGARPRARSREEKARKEGVTVGAMRAYRFSST